MWVPPPLPPAFSHSPVDRATAQTLGMLSLLFLFTFVIVTEYLYYDDKCIVSSSFLLFLFILSSSLVIEN